MPSRRLTLGNGDLHALLELAERGERGERHAALVPLQVHPRVGSA